MRIGISTGFATVGNFGSRDRMDYTIYGNQVNLAARLQSAAEPGGILLSYETNALVQRMVFTEEYPPITVKGFVRPISVYKVLATYHELVDDGKVVLQERDGLRVLVDLMKQVSSEAIKVGGGTGRTEAARLTTSPVVKTQGRGRVSVHGPSRHFAAMR